MPRATAGVSGAPAPHPFPDESDWRYTQHRPFVAVYPSRHRSVYLMQQRIRKQPFLAVFDVLDGMTLTSDRFGFEPEVTARLRGFFRRLAVLDPQASFPPVTILIGRNTSGGTTGKSGVLIGLEVACRSTWLQPDLSDRLYHLIAHEYGHVQQPEGRSRRNGVGDRSGVAEHRVDLVRLVDQSLDHQVGGLRR